MHANFFHRIGNPSAQFWAAVTLDGDKAVVPPALSGMLTPTVVKDRYSKVPLTREDGEKYIKALPVTFHGLYV
jgi:hypothetical protein